MSCVDHCIAVESLVSTNPVPLEADREFTWRRRGRFKICDLATDAKEGAAVLLTSAAGTVLSRQRGN